MVKQQFCIYMMIMRRLRLEIVQTIADRRQAFWLKSEDELAEYVFNSGSHAPSPVTTSFVLYHQHAHQISKDNFVERIQAVHLGRRYQLVELLGEGSFSKVYPGEL